MCGNSVSNGGQYHSWNCTVIAKKILPLRNEKKENLFYGQFTFSSGFGSISYTIFSSIFWSSKKSKIHPKCDILCVTCCLIVCGCFWHAKPTTYWMFYLLSAPSTVFCTKNINSDCTLKKTHCLSKSQFNFSTSSETYQQKLQLYDDLKKKK